MADKVSSPCRVVGNNGFDMVAIEAVAATAVRIFAEGLQKIIDEALAASKETASDLKKEVYLQKQELEVWRQRLTTQALQLDKDRRNMDKERAQFEQEKQHGYIASTSGDRAKEVATPERLVQGSPRVESLHLADDDDYELEADIEPEPKTPTYLFHKKQSSTPSSPSSDPTNPQDHAVKFGDCWYAVLPPRSPEDRTMGRDMWHQVVTVPSGWQVLGCKMEEFDDIMQELSQYCWGTQSLCVQGEFNGVNTYRTALGGGAPGERSGINVSKVTQVSPPVIEKGVEKRGAQYCFHHGSNRLVIWRRSVQGSPRRRSFEEQKSNVVLCNVQDRMGGIQRSPKKKPTNHFGETLPGNSPDDVRNMLKAASDMNLRTPLTPMTPNRKKSEL